MLADELLAAGDRPHHHTAIAVGLVVEVGMGVEHPLRTAGSQKGGMKTLMQPVEIHSTLAEFIAGPLDMPAHLMQRAQNTGLPGIVALGDREPDSLDLDRGPHDSDIE